MGFRLSNKLMGVMRVSFSNLLSLSISLLTSFLLPLFISVKDYGYWQLFIMYTGYVGLFAFGFNDGVHLHYAACSYDTALASKFRTFNRFLMILSLLETVVSIVILTLLFDVEQEKYWVLLFTALNIIPVLVNGLFTYMNQSTMRFKQYAWSTLVDKVIFTILMLLLLLAGCTNYLFYIGAYTLSRYLVSIYHFFSSREVFTTPPQPIQPLRSEILRNFKDGFGLMIAVLLNGSIIVGSRLLVEHQFGIEEFGAFSFSIHTLVIASQFISAIASVFYPILKRCAPEELPAAYGTFDQASTLLAAVLLLSYYPAAVLIQLAYPQYATILSYFPFVYPLFIFQCKSNLLIINTFKVRNQPGRLILANGLAVFLNITFSWVAFALFHTVGAIALATLLAYLVWYYLCQIWIYRSNRWTLSISVFFDAALTGVFIAINGLVSLWIDGGLYWQLLVGCGAYLGFLLLAYLLGRQPIRHAIRCTLQILKD